MPAVVAGEVPVQLPARDALVVAEPVQGALPCQQVHQGGERQEGNDGQVGDRLELEPETRTRVVGELAQNGGDHVDDPRRDGGDNAQPPQHDLPTRRLRMHDGHRLGPLFGTPLAAPRRRVRGGSDRLRVGDGHGV